MRTVKLLTSLTTTIVLSTLVLAQPTEVDTFVRDHQGAIVREFMELVAIPNVRSDLPNIKRNAELLRQMLERRSMKPEVWDTPSTPLVFADLIQTEAQDDLVYADT